jgi:peptidoglycan/LPS O-acetylase OafA/YrhL
MKGKNYEYQEKIDHLRFFGAFAIIIYQSLWTYQLVAKSLGAPAIVPPVSIELLWNGHILVALFMTLSGFLFATICKGKDIDQSAFYRNRFLRIYPLFVVVLLAACYMDPVTNSFWRLMTSLCLLQNLRGSAVQFPYGTENLWAIAVEFQFYLLFPFLLLFYRKHGYKYLFALIALALFTRLGIFCTTGKVWELGYTTIFGRIDQFVVGMIFGFSFDRLKAKVSSPLFLLFSVALVACLAWVRNRMSNFGDAQWIITTDLEALVLGLLIVCYSASAINFPRWLARFFAYGGTVSYSLYLIHPFVLRLSHWFASLICLPHSRFPFLVAIANMLHDQPLSSSLIFGLFVVFPITFLASMLTYAFIERPFLELRTIYGRPRKLSNNDTPERQRQEIARERETVGWSVAGAGVGNKHG